MTTIVMSSNRPYLLRAMYEMDRRQRHDARISSSTPRRPTSTFRAVRSRDGRIVLNIAARAVAQLELGKDRVSFMARFSGVSQVVEVPMGAVLAIYAQENGQGMMFPAEGQTPPTSTPDAAPKKTPHLRVVK